MRADEGERIAVLELVIDGRPTDVLGRFVMRRGEPHARAAEWRAYGVRAAIGLPVGDDALVAAGLLPGVQARVDGPTQSLRIDQAPDLSRLTVLGRPRRAGSPGGDIDDADADATPQATLGAVLNYDVLLQHDALRRTHSGLLDLRVFGRFGVFEHALVAADHTAPGTPEFLRLGTRFTHTDAARMQRLSVGDVIGRGLAWTRPLRVLGVQAMSDFSIRPDLITTPAPQLAGSTALPSTVDVLVNGVRQLSQPVEPGRFEVRQLPIVSGQGEVAVVVRDALGRETVQTLAFYSAPRQLARGLSDYAFEAGRVRRRFGQASADYGPRVATASLRHGLNDSLTVEAHAEGGAGVGLAGLGGQVSAPTLGSFTGHVARSQAMSQGGAQFGLGWERQTRVLSVAAQWSRASEGFRDLASSQGDALVRRAARVSGGVNLGRHGSFGVAWVQRDTQPPTQPSMQPSTQPSTQPQPGGAFPVSPAFPTSAVAPQAPQRLRLLTASYSVALPGYAQAYVSAYRDTTTSGNHGVSVGVSMPLGPRASVSASHTRDRAGASLGVQASEMALEPGEAGWRVLVDQRLDGRSLTRQQIEAEYLSEVAHFNAAVQNAGGSRAARVGTQGALVALGGGLHATRTVHDSVALVEVVHEAATGAATSGVQGVSGVSVHHQNRLVGHTDARGRVLVPGLLSFQANRVEIDPLALPMHVDIDRTAMHVLPADRSGVVVRFGVRESRAALLQLSDPHGAALPLGTVLMPAGGGAASVVGHDGLAYVQGGATGLELSAHWQGRPLCLVRMPAGDVQVPGRAVAVVCQ